MGRLAASVALRTGAYVGGLGLLAGTVAAYVPLQSYGAVWSEWEQATYNALNRVAFVLGVGLVTLPSVYGCRKDPCHILLGGRAFYPLARLTFCVYLVHFSFISLRVASSRAFIYLETFTVCLEFLTDTAYALAGGLALSLLVEGPLLNLEKLLLKSTRTPLLHKAVD
jgi:hypothetical protein